MRSKLLLFLLLLIIQPLAAQDFKVIGYLPSGRFDLMDAIDFDRLTHVNLAFVNPDPQGILSCNGADIDPVVALAHQHGCQVFMSMGGGYLPPEINASWNQQTLPGNRAAFIAQIVQYAQDHELDGVDVDLEWEYVQDWYSPFVLELKAALSPLGISMTAALPASYRYPQISAEALAAYDWINIMAYDLTGPWAPANPGPHAPLDWSLAGIPYWIGQGATSEKLTLGVPFYGYDFGLSPVGAFTFAEIVAEDPANAWIDASGLRFWNGIPTIQAKTTAALEQVAGIMIWEIGGDALLADADFSLLKAIDELVEAQSTGTFDNASQPLSIYPNPVRDRLFLRAPVTDYEGRATIVDVHGRVVLQQKSPGGEVLELDVAHLPPGAYFLNIYTEKGAQRAKFIRI